MHGGGGPGEAAGQAAAEVFAVDTGSFHGLGLSQELSDHLASLGFATPTRVQQQAIPHLLVRKGQGAGVGWAGRQVARWLGWRAGGTLAGQAGRRHAGWAGGLAEKRLGQRG